MIGEKRIAAIVGINEYKDGHIPKLAGAENDAMEIYERLQSTDIGNFKISEDHYLVGAKASCEALRRCISDVFWKSDPSDLVLFYFSGHVFSDMYGNNYMVPYDFSIDEPFVWGIDIKEVKDIISSSYNKDNIVLILDCCYNKTTIQHESRSGFIEQSAEWSFGNLPGKGRIILESVEADERSKEISDCRDQNRSDTHSHGTLTFCLIEGLDGKASDENGIITFSGLYDYLNRQMKIRGRRISGFYEDTNEIQNIKIAVSSQKYRQNIDILINEANYYLKLKDIRAVKHAAEKVSKLRNLEINFLNSNADRLEKDINNFLQNYKGHINEWLTKNSRSLEPQIEKISPNLYPKLFQLERYLSSDTLTKTKQSEIDLLEVLCDVIDNRIIDVEEFIRKCRFIVGVYGSLDAATIDAPKATKAATGAPNATKAATGAPKAPKGPETKIGK